MSESSGDPNHDSAAQADAARNTPGPESGRAVPDVPETDAPETDEHAQPTPELPKSLTFRITRVTLLSVIVLAVCVTPVAWAQPWLLLLYLIPVTLFLVVLRLRTIVDRDMITARTLRTTRVPWDEVQSFRVDQRRWLRAVLRGNDTGRGRKVLLPAVRVRDLPRLAAMSGGRLPDFDTERAGQSDSTAANSDSAD